MTREQRDMYEWMIGTAMMLGALRQHRDHGPRKVSDAELVHAERMAGKAAEHYVMAKYPHVQLG